MEITQKSGQQPLHLWQNLNLEEWLVSERHLKVYSPTLLSVLGKQQQKKPTAYFFLETAKILQLPEKKT